MKADLRYFYVGEYDSEVSVTANVENVELDYRHTGSGANNNFEKLLLTPDDARELAEMLLKAAAHNEDLERSSK